MPREFCKSLAEILKLSGSPIYNVVVILAGTVLEGKFVSREKMKGRTGRNFVIGFGLQNGGQIIKRFQYCHFFCFDLRS